MEHIQNLFPKFVPVEKPFEYCWVKLEIKTFFLHWDPLGMTVLSLCL